MTKYSENREAGSRKSFRSTPPRATSHASHEPRTSNIQHSTSNFEVLWRAVSLRSAFGVRCWMFDVGCFARSWFMVPRRGKKAVEALHEPRSGQTVGKRQRTGALH